MERSGHVLIVSLQQGWCSASACVSELMCCLEWSLELAQETEWEGQEMRTVLEEGARLQKLLILPGASVTHTLGVAHPPWSPAQPTDSWKENQGPGVPFEEWMQRFRVSATLGRKALKP